jgi:hypothetical protein
VRAVGVDRVIIRKSILPELVILVKIRHGWVSKFGEQKIQQR